MPAKKKPAKKKAGKKATPKKTSPERVAVGGLRTLGDVEPSRKPKPKRPKTDRALAKKARARHKKRARCLRVLRAAQRCVPARGRSLDQNQRAGKGGRLQNSRAKQGGGG